MNQDSTSPSGPSGQFSSLPDSVQTGFEEAASSIQFIFTTDEFASWVDEGLALCSITTRSWEAGIEYFKASEAVAKELQFSAFIQWTRCGAYLAQESPSLAAAYFKSSPCLVAHLRPQHIARWAGLGRGLYKGTWKSSTLASKFFELSPSLIQKLPFSEFEEFVGIIENLSNRSHDLATECLILGQQSLPKLGNERESFLSLTQTLVDTNWREVKRALEVINKALAGVDKNQRSRFLLLTERLAKEKPRDSTGFIVRGSESLGKIIPPSQHHILDLCDSLMEISSDAVYPLLRSLDPVLRRISITQLSMWFEKGIHLLKENPEGGLAYFKLESSTSEDMLDSLSSSLDLDRTQGVLRLYCRALSGVDMEVSESSELVQKGIGWVAEGHATTEGTKVFLPPLVNLYPSKRENFGWYKVVSTHQIAHIEFGSFQLEFEAPSSLFPSTRLTLEKQVQLNVADEPHVATSPSGDSADWRTGMSRFFALFPDRKLALDLFTILEDGRLDCRVKVEYPGIKQSYRQVQDTGLETRPALQSLPIRQALVELLVLLSLERRRGIHVPKGYLGPATMLAKIQGRLLSVDATVEDTSEATIRAYKILSLVPNLEEPEEEWETHDFDSNEEFSEDEFNELVTDLEEADGDREDEEQSPYESPQDVDFRGDFKPELVQTLNKMREQQGSDAAEEDESQTLTKEMLEQLLQETAELDLADGEGTSNPVDAFAHNLMKEAGMQSPSATPGQGHGAIGHVDEEGGALEPREPKTYVYDEWDFRAGDYKPKWCIVREKTVDEGDIQFFGDTMHNYASLAADVRRQFEQVMPEGFRKLRRQPEGEEFDLDAAVEATIDRRSGITPSEKVYWFRNKQERDVAVIFLLDMSASTAEAIDESSSSLGDQVAPDEPAEYMQWLRSRRDGLVRRQYKRIIDLEKEGVALLLQALESIGDIYGVYGFSGYGRENVEFYVIKDLDETLTEGIKRRIDKISPLHATRMGPAIRHATTKLDKQTAKTKILFLISDGRPQDRGYSREGVEKEYAVHDTHMALVEARRKDIIPFCLTVDKSGHDYLKTMCGDMSYEILGDISTLPQRLPLLYRKLTV